MVAPLEVDLGVLGWADSLILMVLALVVFGPRRLPQIGRQIGKLMYEFRKASNDFKFQMEEEMRAAEEADRRKKEEERQRAAAAAVPEPALLPTAAVSAGSPYNEDAVYPPSTPAAGDEPAPVESAAADPAPRILPPSTGEPVAASRPGAPAEGEPYPGAATRNGTSHDSPVNESASESPGEPQSTPEQAAHHG